MLREIGGMFLFLLALVIIGNIWFHFIESILHGFNKICTRHKEPPAWHTLPQELEETEHTHEKDKH